MGYVSLPEGTTKNIDVSNPQMSKEFSGFSLEAHHDTFFNSIHQGVRGFSPTWSKKITQQSGQIIATSHDLTSNGGLVREIPLFQGNPGW